MSLETIILPLNPERVDDFLEFFDNEPFLDNPDWSGCYCYFYHASHGDRDWGTRTKSENRAGACHLISESKMEGYLAYAAGNVIGWCHAASRTNIPNLQTTTDLLVHDADEVGSVVCFAVAHDSRKQGVSRQLLEAACQGFRSQGLTIAEGYPRIRATGAAANYHGPLHMYRSAGFKPFRTFQDYMIVRKNLG